MPKLIPVPKSNQVLAEEAGLWMGLWDYGGR
jgi:hypothetical protein